MNPNIEVINENLWVVNFQYVGMGYIRELTFNDKATIDNGMTITNDGKLIFDKSDALMMKYLPVMKAVMCFPDYLLNTERGFCVYVKTLAPKLDNLDNETLVKFLKGKDLYKPHAAIWETACKWEAERRKQKKLYTRKHWFSLWLRKFQKKGR